MRDFDERVRLSRRLTDLGQLLTGRGAGGWQKDLRRSAQLLTDGPAIVEGCYWCGGPIPEGKRSDARFCSDRHRKANHRARGTARDGSSEW